VVITDESTGVSQLLMARARAPPQVYAYESHTSVAYCTQLSSKNCRTALNYFDTTSCTFIVTIVLFKRNGTVAPYSNCKTLKNELTAFLFDMLSHTFEI